MKSPRPKADPRKDGLKTRPKPRDQKKIDAIVEDKANTETLKRALRNSQPPGPTGYKKGGKVASSPLRYVVKKISDALGTTIVDGVRMGKSKPKPKPEPEPKPAASRAMAKGGTVRGMGAATKGGEFGKSG